MNGLITIPNLSYCAVLTVFNAEYTVGRAIQSILDQSLPPTEIFVIDDNSQDNSRQIVRDFVDRDPRIALIENKTNFGQSQNRNVGVFKSKSDFVVFFDDDDQSLPGRALEHSKMFQSGASISFVSSEIRYMNGYSVQARNAEYSGILDFQKLVRKLLLGEVNESYADLSIPASTLAVRTKEFKTVGGFDPGLRRLEDVDLALKYAQSRQVFGFSSSLLVDRYSTLSMSKGNGIDMKFESLLLNRYRGQLIHSEYVFAQKHCRTRQLYFSKQYPSLFLHLLMNPDYSLNILKKPRTFIRRLVHDYRRRFHK